MKRLFIIIAAVLTTLVVSTGPALACGHQPPPPCHRHHLCRTPTSPRPPTVTTHKTTSKNHCHVRVIRHRTVTYTWRWDTHLCRWVKCRTVTVTVVLRHHKSHCGPGHHRVHLPKAGTTATTTCAVKGCKP